VHKGSCVAYAIKGCEMPYLLLAALELGIQLGDDFVGQHCRRVCVFVEADEAPGLVAWDVVVALRRR
jgi:uncharacterized protein YwlG (UPF0340 family)